MESSIAEDPTVALFALHEQRMLERDVVKRAVPVLVVCGPLGAGKTTLLNHILANKLNLRVTCVINDLAELDIDASQLVRRDDAREVMTLSNGCACHTLRSAFEGELGSYLSRTDGADRIDYVVIETSGVAEPMPLVDAVTRRFGKLARARLDSVVAVFDADSVAHRLGLLGDGSSGSLDALETVQMRGADLILLNKADLLPADAVDALCASMRAAAPWAAVRTCTRGVVPLPVLMGVERIGGIGGGDAAGGVTHEAAFGKGAYETLADGRLRASPPAAPRPFDGVGVGGDHARDFWCAEFESEEPLSMSAFQDLVAASAAPLSSRNDPDAAGPDGADAAAGLDGRFCGALARAVRAKGVLWFGECRSDRWLFHVSGRGRVQIEHDGVWHGRPRVQLVAIGRRGSDGEAPAADVRAALCATRAPESHVLTMREQGVDDAVAAAAALIHADDRFELIEPTQACEEAGVAGGADACGRAKRARHRSEVQRPGRVVHFQLVGAAKYRISRAELASRHGVDIDGMNRSLLAIVNGALPPPSGVAAARTLPKPCLTGAPLAGARRWRPAGSADSTDAFDAPVFTLRYAGGGVCRLDHVWPAIAAAAGDVLERACAHIAPCRCDA